LGSGSVLMLDLISQSFSIQLTSFRCLAIRWEAKWQASYCLAVRFAVLLSSLMSMVNLLRIPCVVASLETPDSGVHLSRALATDAILPSYAAESVSKRAIMDCALLQASASAPVAASTPQLPCVRKLSAG
jgi:hypothetical protein